VSNYYRPGGFGGFSFFPPVIKNLLIINGVIFFVQILLEQVKFDGYPGWYIINKWFALNPLYGIDPAGKPFNFQVWQLISYQFMHGNFSHIFFNMFALWMFGMEIENMWGSKKFLYFYLLCGVVAGLCHLFLSPLFGYSSAYTLGASGAIYGVLVGFAMFNPNRYIFLYFLLPIKAKYLIIGIILLDFIFINSGDSVARLAHLGGALTGAVFILVDKSNSISLRSIFGGSGGGRPDFNKFGEKFQNPFKRKEPEIQEAKFKDLNDEGASITQAEIDAILDKISQSGYQNLTEREKKILFEASKRMK
jgi:membrane associated rhomboid family serine protease